MTSRQNSVLTAVTDTASLPGFTYAVAVKIPDEVPVGLISPLFKCHYGLRVTLNLVCAAMSYDFTPLIYY